MWCLAELASKRTNSQELKKSITIRETNMLFYGCGIIILKTYAIALILKIYKKRLNN